MLTAILNMGMDLFLLTNGNALMWSSAHTHRKGEDHILLTTPFVFASISLSGTAIARLVSLVTVSCFINRSQNGKFWPQLSKLIPVSAGVNGHLSYKDDVVCRLLVYW